MPFDDVQFPLTISYGSRGGPGFSTNVIRTDSGASRKVSRWASPLRTYDVSFGVKTRDDLFELIAFYIARLGPGRSFRFHDHLDYTTANNHRDSPSETDEQIGVGDGTTTDFQLVATYTSGPITRTRNLTKIVSGTTVVALDGTPTGSGWSVNLLTGIITFTAAPSNGVVVTAGCEFDVPVSFGHEMDEVLSVALDDFDVGSIPSIILREDLSDPALEAQDEYPYRGGENHGDLSADITLVVGNGLVHIVEPTTGGYSIYLPDATNLALGGPYFFFSNGGSASVTIRNSGGTSLEVLSPAEAREVWLGMDSGGARTWYLF